VTAWNGAEAALSFLRGDFKSNFKKTLIAN
jgi:hypothetical protein